MRMSHGNRRIPVGAYSALGVALLLVLTAAPASALALVSLVKNINPSGDSDPGSAERFGQELFFAADDGSHGRELWKSDGSEPGTKLVANINPGATSSRVAFLTNVGGRLLFFATGDGKGQELWTSDGKKKGTERVEDINPEGDAVSPSGFTPTMQVGHLFFFAADDDKHGVELWRSDGTRAGTRLVEDINDGGGDSQPESFARVGHRLYFAAFDPQHGNELWSSNGTREGTKLVASINPGIGSSEPGPVTEFKGDLFFGADDGDRGRELWRSNGTQHGTRLVKKHQPSRGRREPRRAHRGGP